MTLSQLRAALDCIATFGPIGAPTGALPIGRWLELKSRRVVEYLGNDRWRLTARGRFQIAHHAQRGRLRQAG